MMNNILNQIDAEIAKLQQARNLLSGAPDVLPTVTKGRGRPKGFKAKAEAPVKSKRTMSPETRAKMAKAQQARHAAKKVFTESKG